MAKVQTQLLDNKAAMQEIENHHVPAGATFTLVDMTKITVRIGDRDGDLYTCRLVGGSRELVTIHIVTGAVNIGD